MPRLVSTRMIGASYPKPLVLSGDPYAAGGDPFPSFTFRVVSSPVSRTCGRRHQVFGVLDGCVPVVFWDEGSSHVDEVACHAPTR